MFDKDKFAKIIKEIKEIYSSQEELAKKSGIGRTSLSQYMNMQLDKAPKPNMLEKIANASRGITTYDELMQICGYINDNKIVRVKQSLFDNNNGFHVVPILVSNNGNLYETSQNVVLPFQWDGTHQYFGYQHHNDEMYPLLSTKDIAIIQKTDTYEDKKTYLLRLDNQIYIRKIIINDDGIELQAMNVCVPVIKLINEEMEKRNFTILGKVIKAENKSYFE